MSRFITTWSHWTAMFGGLVVALCPSFAGIDRHVALGSSPSESHNVGFHAWADADPDRSESAEGFSCADFYFHRYGRLAMGAPAEAAPVAEDPTQYVSCCPAEEAEQIPPAETYEGAAVTGLAVEEEYECIADDSDETRVTLEAALAEAKAREEDARRAAELADMANPFGQHEDSMEASFADEFSEDSPEEAAYRLATADANPADNAAAMPSDHLAPEGLPDYEHDPAALAYQEAEYHAEIAREYRPEMSIQEESTPSMDDSAEEEMTAEAMTDAEAEEADMVRDRMASQPTVFAALKSLFTAPLAGLLRSAETTSARLAAVASGDWLDLLPNTGGEITLD